MPPPSVERGPNLLRLVQRIAKKGDCVEMVAATPAVNNSGLLLFPGSLEAVLTHDRCSGPKPQG